MHFAGKQASLKGGVPHHSHVVRYDRMLFAKLTFPSLCSSRLQIFFGFVLNSHMSILGSGPLYCCILDVRTIKVIPPPTGLCRTQAAAAAARGGELKHTHSVLQMQEARRKLLVLPFFKDLGHIKYLFQHCFEIPCCSWLENN